MSTTDSITMAGYKVIRKVIDGSTFLTAIREEGTQACDLVYITHAPILCVDACNFVYVNRDIENDFEQKTCRAHVSSCRLVKSRKADECRSFGAVNVERPYCFDVTTYPLDWEGEPIENIPIPSPVQRLVDTKLISLASSVIEKWKDIKHICVRVSIAPGRQRPAQSKSPWNNRAWTTWTRCWTRLLSACAGFCCVLLRRVLPLEADYRES